MLIARALMKTNAFNSTPVNLRLYQAENKELPFNTPFCFRKSPIVKAKLPVGFQKDGKDNYPELPAKF